MNQGKGLILFRFRDETLYQAASLYSSTKSIVIPALLPFCSARLTAMERLRGVHLPITGAISQRISANVSSQVLVEALVAHPIFSPELAALFHADPHGGNLLFMPGGRVGVLDWSLTGRLPREQRSDIIQLMLAAATLDLQRMGWAVQRLAQGPANQAQLREVLCASLRQLRWGGFPGLTWVTRLLDQLALRAGVRLTPNLVLFRKSLLTLEGVLADLSGWKEGLAQATMDAVPAAAFLKHWLNEWPDRFWTPFRTKSPRTHLSTADLLALTCSGLGTAARSWGQGAEHVFRLGCLCPQWEV